ncbi:NF038122 family metalloprotease [Phenylobacterium sp.]|uniref:NF038122 family metalloprotease n=1 Tax=Phenylobacterium sp. TaxID=1871053 RepID=UPI002DF4F4AA|nr:NF038122 family metalloprotease [Phenylobacterium sp.]
MPFDTEAVTTAGSGLVFINSYDATVSDAYHSAIIAAEHELQSHFTNSVTVNASFTLSSLGPGAAASNGFSTTSVSYSAFTAALRAHVTTADDLTAVNGLPGVDPSGGAGFAIPVSMARMLGLQPQTNSGSDDVTLNSNLAWSFGQDAIGAIEHELTEGAFGRIGSLGIQGSNGKWAPMDLFRFAADGTRDLTGGSDGVTTFFGIDSAHISALQYHAAISAAGVDDGGDLADFDHVRGDSFGPGGPNSPGHLSATDLQVLDVLGWNSTPFVPAADDFANSLTDPNAPIGLIAPGGTISGTLQQAGDRDWFRVNLQAGTSYTIKETGHLGGGGTLADPFLRLHDAAGGLVASNDDIVDGANPDSLIAFTAPTTGTYFIEAGAYVDGYQGSYTVSVSSGAAGAASPGDVLLATAAAPSVTGGVGNDTITGWSGGDVLRGGDGNDSIVGGAGFDDINGNKGDDTIVDTLGGNDWLVGGQGNDLITATKGQNILYGNLGNDTLHGGSGGELMRGGQGDDSIVGGSGNDWISGDRGNDTLVGGAGADTFHTFSGAGIDRVLDFHISEGDRVQVDLGTSWTVVQVGADTVIDMGNGDQMILVGVQMTSLTGNWIFTV